MIKDISVIVPAYNEERRIGKTLRKITAYLGKRKINYEIIVVDDGSSDRTSAVAGSFSNPRIKILSSEKNRGKGYSVKKGLLSAKYGIALFSDADLSTPIEDIGKLERYIDDYGIVIGSRKEKGANVVEKQPPWRVMAGNIFPLFVNIMTGLGIKDTQCGFKLFRVKKCRQVFKKMTIDGFSFDVEMLYIAKKKGLKIKEVGVDWNNDRATKVRFVRDSFSMLMDLIGIWVKSIAGRY
ncbi:TPA: glycosyltransferase family 2 protein [Candidatus Woesearchaeota archaeon]|nr:hypothetical protein QT06_C0001G0511 [archaeon GW2011_AR15]MBS3103822.1 glycosyltransferase family 2 protein [Candidatus Woesearchaeota archaeon]HIH41888.1 glycosyltransferase family 2 protein [Candidatus Woesearchaeota archaeon]